jgi:hypothetical protein
LYGFGAVGLDDYLEVVKEPMDLSTIETKLEGGSYTEPKQFLGDMRREQSQP